MQKVAFIISLIFTLMLIGCNSSTTQADKPQDPPKRQISAFIDDVAKAHPNINNNDITRSVFADSITSAFQKFKGDTLPFIYDLPIFYKDCELYKRTFETFECEIDKDAGRYLVYFLYGERNVDGRNILFKIYSVLDKDDASKLIDGTPYHISGVFRDFANNSRETGLVFPDGKCLIDYPKVFSSNDTINLYLGSLVLDSLKFTPYEKIR